MVKREKVSSKMLKKEKEDTHVHLTWNTDLGMLAPSFSEIRTVRRFLSRRSILMVIPVVGLVSAVNHGFNQIPTEFSSQTRSAYSLTVFLVSTHVNNQFLIR